MNEKTKGISLSIQEKNGNAVSPSVITEKKIHCFYNNRVYPCSFITNTERKMENHYRKVHYLKEVVHA
jgi:hypothetical protein